MKFAMTRSSVSVASGKTRLLRASVRRRKPSPQPLAFSMSLSSTPVAIRKNITNACPMTSSVVDPNAARKCTFRSVRPEATRYPSSRVPSRERVPSETTVKSAIAISLRPRRGLFGQSAGLEGGELVLGREKGARDAETPPESLEVGLAERFGDRLDRSAPADQEQRRDGRELERRGQGIRVGLETQRQRQSKLLSEGVGGLRIVLQHPEHAGVASATRMDALHECQGFPSRLAVAVPNDDEGWSRFPCRTQPMRVALRVPQLQVWERPGRARHQASTKSATTRVGITPAAWPRSRKAWTARRPRSPHSSVMSLTHMPTKRSAIPGSIPRAKRMAYSRASARCASE